MAGVGINIYQPADIGAQGQPNQLVFTTKYPFTKLDSQNQVSFQNLNLFFNNDPANPNGTSVFSQTTTIYEFPHGYSYLPTIWVLFNRIGGAGVQNNAASTRYSSYGYEGNIIAASSAADNANFAILNIVADNQNVYLTVIKQYTATLGSPVNLVGYSLLIRFYVFVEPMLPSN